MASSCGESDGVFCAIEATLNEAASKGKITRCIFISREDTSPNQLWRRAEDTAAESATVRLVFLPLEAQGYAARESIERLLWEMDSRLDTYVEHPAPAKPAAEQESTRC